MNIGKMHFLLNTKIIVITTNVSVLDIEKTNKGIYTVNHLTNFFFSGSIYIKWFLKSLVEIQ